MTHPDPDCNRYQAEFLEKCPAGDRAMHELIFKIGNATFRYHELAKTYQPTEADWKEWIAGLPDPVQSAMREKGFDDCRTILSFTRYVNEKNDVGLDAYLKENISPKDLMEYNKILNT